jgi:predicted phosphodiesterase
VKIVALSDTHNRHSNLTIPECDILVHAGDATAMGSERDVRNFAKWFNDQPATYKIFVPGNHELEFEKNLPASKLWFQELCPEGILLMDEGVCIEGLNIWGSPVTPWFRDWAFNRQRGLDIKAFWDAIPEETDILITHGPPLYIRDSLYRWSDKEFCGRVGCEELAKRVFELPKLKYHIFGHIHCSHGEEFRLGKHFYNVAICDDRNFPVNDVTVIEV